MHNGKKVHLLSGIKLCIKIEDYDGDLKFVVGGTNLPYTVTIVK